MDKEELVALRENLINHEKQIRKLERLYTILFYLSFALVIFVIISGIIKTPIYVALILLSWSISVYCKGVNNQKKNERKDKFVKEIAELDVKIIKAEVDKKIANAE